MKYGIIFWENSHDSKGLFTLRKQIVRIIMGAKALTPCGDLFMKLHILPLQCVYIFSLLNFIINNLEQLQTNSAIHCVSTRNKHYLHRPVVKKSTYYFGTNIFNNLPVSLKSLMNEKAKFKIALKQYLNTHSFCSVDEFLLPTTETAC
jgi:hypothetical protein